ncbi:hypothetical protein C2G38_2175681 [Gigaspora rosea]|uniref:Uncharacterized protein n=1 Tax=Gigaspora rosea TaxID=44941 RepID=A0A397U2D4_9GLOM|nr:hypothetical protein C2G38_2222590 [Gigaspora rosea]RIB21756.1 hypothetical protein C2G38_2175681 [Gigaspora rosea]
MSQDSGSKEIFGVLPYIAPEPQKRSTAEELVDEESELYEQIEKIKNSGKNSSMHDQANQTNSTRFNYQSHKQAIYTSRLLNFRNLPKPVNAAISRPIKLDEVPDMY